MLTFRHRSFLFLRRTPIDSAAGVLSFLMSFVRKRKTRKSKTCTADIVIVVIAVYYSNFIHSVSIYQII